MAHSSRTTVNASVSPEIYAALVRIAEETKQPLGQVAGAIIRDHLAKDYDIKATIDRLHLAGRRKKNQVPASRASRSAPHIG
jgi:hypothetical protein